MVLVVVVEVVTSAWDIGTHIHVCVCVYIYIYIYIWGGGGGHNVYYISIIWP